MTPKEHLIQALKGLCEREGGHVVVADAIGANEQTIWQIINGVKLPSGNPRGVGPALQQKLAERYPGWANMPGDAVVAGPRFARTAASLAPVSLDDNPDYPAIRRVRFKLSAGASGFGIEYINDPAPPIVFQREWYEQRGYLPAKLFAIKILNGSMEPGLFDGDTVVVNTAANEPRDGVVFAVNYEGELVIKRLVRDAGQWWLSSDNPDQSRYPRKVCHEDVFILGEIIHKQSEQI